MIVVNDNRTVNGNTVLAPIPERKEQDNSKQQLKKNFNEEKRRKVRKKMAILRNIALLFVIAILLLGRYSAIYSMQRNLADINNQINDVNVDNDNLKVELVKFDNIDYVKDIAEKRLHMVEPTKNSVIYSDLSKDNFEAKHADDKNNVKGQKFLDKVVNILF